jgi:catechol 2,3-dioxygenase-like lactoylglutathione lyase family enzyme
MVAIVTKPIESPQRGDLTTFKRVAPVIPVRDLDAALDRYRRLGFAIELYEGGARYGFADRGGVSLHLNESDDHDPKACGAVLYLYVSDADAVHAEWAAAALPGRLSAPQDMSWGLREFGYVDPDGTLHRVGSRLEPS